ncbi:hydrogen peroxide-inducible genes activator [uncultured Turicimonas sp.]|uniref:hydrogen peroxide-inducible genes activator n=1 Tax=uncultured Turicimonas sp. TaxID=1918607 RepID=UPI002803BD24|nr:hydrogen peroxide-inducible genes activator [uncultured Turicimonas sp.]
MTLNELKYAIAVAQLRHFGKAAEKCQISQPSLSVAIKKLEQDLGVQIFERKNTEISLTPIGQRIIEQAKVVLDEAKKIRQIPLEESDPLNGPIRMGVIYTVSPYLLPELIKRSIERTPQMPLIINEGYTTDLIQKLKSGLLDVVICALPIYDETLSCSYLYEEEFVALVPAKHPLASKSEIESKELIEEKMLILAQGNCFRDQVLKVCPDSLKNEPNPNSHLHFMEGSTLSTLRYMVSSGIGVSVFPASAKNYDVGDQLTKYVEFKKPVPTRLVAILWRKSFPRVRAVQRIAETCSHIKLEGIHHLPFEPHSLSRDGY